MINFVTLAVHLLNQYITTDTVDFFIEYLHIIISRFNHFALKRENLNLRMQNFSQNHTFIQFTSVRPIKARFQILRCLLLAILHGNKFLLVMNLQKHISIFFSNEKESFDLYLYRNQSLFVSIYFDCFKAYEKGLDKTNLTCSTTDFALTIDDINDNAPNFIKPNYTGSVDENAKISISFDESIEVKDIDQVGCLHDP